MSPPFNSRRKQNCLLSPSPQTKIAHAKRGLIFVIVDITEQSWNQLHSWVLEASEVINGLRYSKKSIIQTV